MKIDFTRDPRTRSPDRVRHLVATCEGAYLVYYNMPDCEDPTHYGGTVLDSAVWLDEKQEKERAAS